MIYPLSCRDFFKKIKILLPGGKTDAYSAQEVHKAHCLHKALPENISTVYKSRRKQ